MFDPRLIAAAMLASTAAYAGSGASTSPFATPPAIPFDAVPADATGQPLGQGGKPHPVIARLMPSEVAAPGTTTQVGIHLDQQDEWHTYWKTPGDIGLPTTIQWYLPEGWSVDTFMQPVPLRFEAENLISFGYDDQVLHIAPVTIPEGTAPGRYPVEADVEWLVCKTSCIPGKVKLKGEIEVAAESSPTVFSPQFDHFKQQWPDALTSTDKVNIELVYSIEPVVANSSFQAAFLVTPSEGHTLNLPNGDALWPTFVPIAGNEWMVDGMSWKPYNDGFAILINGLAFEPAELPDHDAIGGLFQLRVDGEVLRIETETSVPWAAADTPTLDSTHSVFDTSEPQAQAAAAPEPATPEHPVATATTQPAPVPTPDTLPAEPAGSLFAYWMLAFAGGLILNVMPCVLPVLMLKLYSLVDQVDITEAKRKKAGMAYTGGILASFWVLAAAVWGIREVLGNQVGWGFQMQYPGYVAGLATAVFLFALSLFGVFEIPAFGMNKANEMSGKSGVSGYFFTGVFATLVATPCSAPLLGPAIAFAFGASTLTLVSIFTFIGLGLAFPFLIIAFVPAAFRYLPKPGEWMETFKQFLGFSLVATTVWLVDVLGGQLGADGVTGFLIFLMFVALSAWIFGRFGNVMHGPSRQLGTLAVAVLLSTGAAYQFLDLTMATDTTCDDGSVETALDYSHEIPWQPFSESRVEALKGQTIFIDFTADWCVSCKVNEATILETETVRSAMQEHNVVALKADWTRQDPVITKWLERFERAGVPLYLVIPPGGEAQAVDLPEVITPDMVVSALSDAASKG